MDRSAQQVTTSNKLQSRNRGSLVPHWSYFAVPRILQESTFLVPEGENLRGLTHARSNAYDLQLRFSPVDSDTETNVVSFTLLCNYIRSLFSLES